MENSSPAQPAAVLLQIAPEDNVGVLIQSVREGSVLSIRDRKISLPFALGLGHKIALRPIPRGEKILKYGCPIGSATRDIALGEHVHLQNMKSDYLPTYTLNEGEKHDH